jgi:predicted RNase H-like HicB family nuclease
MDEYRITIRPLSKDEGGGHLAEYPEIPGCMSDGETIEEAITNGREALRDCLAVRTSGLKNNRPLINADTKELLVLRAFGGVFAVLLLTGCGELSSVEGLANRDNIVFEPLFVGAWNAGDAVIIVQAGDEKSYRIDWLGTEGNKEVPQVVRMEGRLAKVGEQRVLDLNAAEPGAFSVPCHVFLRIRQVDAGWKVQFIDSKWIREQAKASGLASFVSDGHPVLTAPASQVLEFLTKFGFDERALDEPMMLRPMKQK